MPQPQSYPEAFPQGIQIHEATQGELIPSLPLVEILTTARTEYQWKDTPSRSQQTVIDLEQEICRLIDELTPEKARRIVSLVSRWGGNKGNAQSMIDSAEPGVTLRMKACIESLLQQVSSEATSLDHLCKLPGLKLVMASKIFRFCCPDRGSSLDRHSSYFFNSLPIRKSEGSVFATNFRREWSTGKHTTSRLAIYQEQGHMRNLKEYEQVYLPLLRRLATHMNERALMYTCAATGHDRQWRATDVEMAAYHWWSKHGCK